MPSDTPPSFYITFGHTQNNDNQETIVIPPEDAEILLEETLSALSLEYNEGLEAFTTILEKVIGNSGVRK